MRNGIAQNPLHLVLPTQSEVASFAQQHVLDIDQMQFMLLTSPDFFSFHEKCQVHFHIGLLSGFLLLEPMAQTN